MELKQMDSPQTNLLKYIEFLFVELTKQSFQLKKTYINNLLSKYKWKTNLKGE